MFLKYKDLDARLGFIETKLDMLIAMHKADKIKQASERVQKIKKEDK